MKKLLLFLVAGMLCLTSCTETFAPNVDYGEQTYINDYTTLVDAVNDLNDSLSNRFDALNELLTQGLAEITVAIDENTGAIEVLTSTTKEGLDSISSTLLSGFTALTTQIKENGELLVTAINENGELIQLAIDANGQVISTAITTSTIDLKTAIEAVADAVNHQTDSLITVIDALEQALTKALSAQTDTLAKRLELMVAALELNNIGIDALIRTYGIYDIDANSITMTRALWSLVQKDTEAYNAVMDMLTPHVINQAYLTVTVNNSAECDLLTGITSQPKALVAITPSGNPSLLPTVSKEYNETAGTTEIVRVFKGYVGYNMSVSNIPSDSEINGCDNHSISRSCGSVDTRYYNGVSWVWKDSIYLTGMWIQAYNSRNEMYMPLTDKQYMEVWYTITAVNK